MNEYNERRQTMDYYINRDKLIKRRHGCNRDCSKCDFAEDGDSWCEGELFVVDVLRQPAADVRPVKRGKWVKANGSWFTPGGDPVWECSECGKGRHVYGVEHGTYGADIADGQWVSCPNCGAYM